MTAKVSSRGQTVIPAKIRKRYGIKPNSKVEFLDNGKEIILVPIPKDPFEASWGILKGSKLSTRDLIAMRRQEAKREEKELKRLLKKPKS